MSRDQQLAKEIERLSDLDTVSLKQRWTELFEIEPVARISTELLVRAVACRLQEEVHGGLSKAACRQIAKYGEELRSSRSMAGMSGAKLKPGTKLIREWQGKVHEVVILGGGYSWSGQHYRSLSEIARAITGTRWSGPRFFGTESAKRPRSVADPGPPDETAVRTGASNTPVVTAHRSRRAISKRGREDD